MLVRELSKAWINSVMIHRHSSKSSRDWTITNLYCSANSDSSRLLRQEWHALPMYRTQSYIKPVHRKRYITTSNLIDMFSPRWTESAVKPFRSLLLIFALIINVVDVVGVVSLGTVFEVVGRTEEANLQLIDFIYVAEKEKEAAETQRKLAYGVHNPREWAVKKTWTQSASVFRWMGSRERSITN